MNKKLGNSVPKWWSGVFPPPRWTPLVSFRRTSAGIRGLIFVTSMPRSSRPSAFRKSFRWYAYRNGLNEELRCESMMNTSSSPSGTAQSLQNFWIVFMVYKGIQQMMKNRTIIERFWVVLTSRFWTAPSTRSITPDDRPECCSPGHNKTTRRSCKWKKIQFGCWNELIGEKFCSVR